MGGAAARLAPWVDRAGRFSWLRLAAFALVLLPGLLLAHRWLTADLGPRPMEVASRDSGLWAVYFLVFGLAVTPLRRIGGWPALTQIRRMLGLAALGYTLLHLAVFVVAQGYDAAKVAGEIVARAPLGVGFATLIGLCVLGATSFDAMVRRMGPRRWSLLHSAVYGLTALALLHYLMQTKLDITAPVHLTGLFLLLMGFRVAVWRGLRLGVPVIAGITLGVAVLVALVEAGWYAGVLNAPFWAVLGSNADPFATTRPAWWTLVSGALFAAIAPIRAAAARA